MLKNQRQTARKNVIIEIPEFEDIQSLTNLLITGKEAILVFDYHTETLVSVNYVMLKMFAYSYEEIINGDLGKLSAGSTPYTVKEASRLFALVKKKHEVNFEWYNRRKNGTLFWTENLIKVVILNNIKRIILISRDITTLKNKQLKLQSELIERTSEVNALNEKLTVTNEELTITNEELEEYKKQLEKLVAIRTTELNKKEESLNYRINHEKFVAELVSRFFNLPPELIDSNITTALHEISDFTHSDAAFLVEIKYKDNLYRITHYWKDDEINLTGEFTNHAPLSDFNWWMEKLPEQKEFIVTSNTDLPDGTFAQNLFKKSGIKSLVFVPIYYQGYVLGIIGFCSTDKNKKWSSDEISLGNVAGETFIGAVKRMISEKFLIESERNYREIYNATSEAIIVFDANSAQIIDLNQAAINMFDISYDELVHQSRDIFNKLSLRIDKNTLLNHIYKAIDKGSIVFDWKSNSDSSVEYWTEISLKRTEIAGELRIIAVLRDISERKRSQELVEQSEIRFRSIIQYLTDIIWIIDEQTIITYESPASWQVLGHEPGYLIGKKGLEIIHSADMPVVKTELEKVLLNTNDHQPTLFRVKHSKGHWITLEVIANNMLDHPAINGIIITARDVTERERVEKALTLSEDKFRNIFNNSSDAIVIINNEFTFREVNEVFLKTTGYSADEAKAMKLTEITSDTCLPEIIDTLNKMFKNEYATAVECEIRTKSKSTYPAELNSKLIDFEGEQAVIAVIRDITERRVIENKILDAIISTEENEREKFARNLHDELGPLLSSIKMYVNSITPDTEKSKLNFITSQLKSILNEVIQSTKELSNDLSPHVLANYGLFAAIEWFIDQVKPYITVTFESNLKNKRLSISYELSVYRIIKELINNTLKHANATSITIRLHEVLHSVHLFYADNGTGFKNIKKENQQKKGMGMPNIISRCRSMHASNKFYNNAPNGMSFEMEFKL